MLHQHSSVKASVARACRKNAKVTLIQKAWICTRSWNTAKTKCTSLTVSVLPCDVYCVRKWIECCMLCRVPTPPRKFWKVLEFLLENFQDLESPGTWPWSWKVLEINLQGPDKSWILLGSDVHVCFWFQIGMFMQTKIAIIVSIRYVFWTEAMQKMLFTAGVPLWTSLAELTALSQTH